jgi:hypothetical protein
VTIFVPADIVLSPSGVVAMESSPLICAVTPCGDRIPETRRTPDSLEASPAVIAIGDAALRSCLYFDTEMRSAHRESYRIIDAIGACGNQVI